MIRSLDAIVFDSIKAICEFRLGRDPGVDARLLGGAALRVEELVDCLRELVKSVKRHTDSGGRQGYLTFIDRFLK